MSKKSKSSTVAAANDGGTPPTAPGPVTTAYQQLANDVVKSLDAVEATLPPLESRHPSTTDFVHSHLNIPLSKLATVVSHIEQRVDLQGFGTLDPVRGRQVLQLAEAYPVMIERARRFADKVEYTFWSLVAELTADCQQTTALVQALARDPNSGDLPIIADNMKEAMGRKGPRKKKVVAPPPPAVPHAA